MDKGGFLNPKLRVRRSPLHSGQGVFVEAPVARGELLALFGGSLMDADQLRAIDRTQHRYSLQVDDELYLVSSTPTAPDFVNHACEPNAGMQGQIGLVALRELWIDEEVRYDYAMSDGSSYDEFPCACGTPLCRSHVRGTDWMRPELQLRYAGFFSPYLARRIERLAAALAAPKRSSAA